MIKKIILASHNEGKLKELQSLLSPFHIEIIPITQFALNAPEETGSSFEENASIIALYAAKHLSEFALADDSGLKISCLQGEPGIYSADWALTSDGKRDYNQAMKIIYQRMLAKNAFGQKNTKASFVSVFCFASPEGEKLYFRGATEGNIVWPPKGENGFGYDAIFQPLGYDRTFAQMSLYEKLYGIDEGKQSFDPNFLPNDFHPLSHRSRALQDMLKFLLGQRDV